MTSEKHNQAETNFSANQLVGDTDLMAIAPLARAKTEVTVHFMLELHNLASPGSEIRTRVIDAIRSAAIADEKAHWARGLIQRPDGELCFDEARYLRAVYQGKQDTYAKSAQKAYDQLREAIESVAHFQGQAQVQITQGGNAAIVGAPVVGLTEPTLAAAQLSNISGALPQLLNRMAGGMDVAFAPASVEDAPQLELGSDPSAKATERGNSAG